MPHQNVGQKKKAKEIVFPLSVAKMKVLLIGSRKKKKSNKTNSTFSGTYLPKRSKLNVIFK